jgi:Na+-transporting NADH:ubiquinone oxidoreductase subunit NqrA
MLRRSFLSLVASIPFAKYFVGEQQFEMLSCIVNGKERRYFKNVYCDFENGSDTNSGLSWFQAKKTLAHCTELMGPGSTVHCVGDIKLLRERNRIENGRNR